MLKKYREKIKHRMGLTLRKNQFKMDIAIKTRMYKEDAEENKEFATPWFCGGARTILREDQFDEEYAESVKKVWNNFEKWISNGSGWRVVGLKTYIYILLLMSL